MKDDLKECFQRYGFVKPGNPMKEMAGMRDKLIHDYMGIELRIIWKTIQEEIPELESLLKRLLSDKD